MIASTVDDYLGRVRRSLAGMDRSVRDDLVRELGANLADAVRANGGNVSAALGAMGPPGEVARRYREVYGYGSAYKVAFIGAAGTLGLFTLPVLAPNPELANVSVAPTLVLVVLIGFLLWISVEAGAVVGLAAGLAAAAARLTGFAVVQLGGQSFTGPGLGLLVVVSALLVAIGWLPGRTKRAWTKPGASL